MLSSEKKLILRQISQKKRSFSEVNEQNQQSPKSIEAQLPPISKDIKKLKNFSLTKSTEFKPRFAKQQLYNENSNQYLLSPCKSAQVDQSTEESSKLFSSSSQLVKSSYQSPRDLIQEIKTDVFYQKSGNAQEAISHEILSIQNNKNKRITVNIRNLSERQEQIKDSLNLFEKRKKANTTIIHQVKTQISISQSSEDSQDEKIQSQPLTQKYQQDQSDNNFQKNKVIEHLKLQLFYPSALENDLNKIDQNVMFNNAKLKQLQKQQNETPFVIKRLKNSKKIMQF